MSTPTSGSGPTPDTDLPDPVVTALDEVETGLQTVTPTDDLARLALTDDVVRHLERRRLDPIARALLSRPKIVAWCLEQALQVMTQPGRYPAPPDIAERLLAIVATELRPTFVEALVRHTSTSHGLGITDEETAAVMRQLLDAASGHAPGDLDLIVGQLLARYRSQAGAARTYQDTLAAFGPRAQQAAATPGDAGAGSGRPLAPTAVPLSGGGTYGATTQGVSAAPSDRCDPPCAVAGIELCMPCVDHVGDLSSDEAVLAAGVVAVIYQLGDRSGIFRAVDTAVQQLDGDQLCVEDPCLLNHLSCWSEIDHRIRAPERARLVAQILGLRDPHLREGVVPDPRIQGLLTNLLDAINANCDPGWRRAEPSAAELSALRWATQAVRAQLSSSVSTYSILRIKQLQVQFGKAKRILGELAPYVRGRTRCRTQPTNTPGHEWVAVSALNGDRLPDGSDLFAAVAIANAWRIVFAWLACPGEVGVLDEGGDLCQAAALLRPPRASHYT